jgi:DNA-binding NtrC family response regulator
MSENGRKPSIVIVDNNLAEMEQIKTFLETEQEFDVQTFTDPAETERFFESHPVDVAISDCRIGKTTGLQLLKRLKEIQPESSRVLLTGCTDVTIAVEAINEVALFQYLQKPCDEEQLLLAVRSAAERSRLLRELREKIEQLDSAHVTLKTAQQRLIHAFL